MFSSNSCQSESISSANTQGIVGHNDQLLQGPVYSCPFLKVKMAPEGQRLAGLTVMY